MDLQGHEHYKKSRITDSSGLLIMGRHIRKCFLDFKIPPCPAPKITCQGERVSGFFVT